LSRLLRPAELPARGCVALNLVDLERRGQELIERARLRAAELLAAARRDAAAVAEDARRSGLEAGKAEGLALGREEGRAAGSVQGLAEARAATATLEQTMAGLVAELAARRETLVKQAERDLLRLAVAVAARIVRRELALDSRAAARATAEAISLAAEKSRVVVRVNGADLEALRAVHDEFTRRFADLQDFKMVGDQTVERGGCRLLTDAGEVDMQVATQLDRLEQLLLGEADIDAGTHPPGGGEVGP